MYQKILFTILLVSGFLSPVLAQSYLDLRYKFTEGDHFQIKQHAEQNTYLDLGSEKQRTTNQTDALIDLTVKSVTPANATLEASYKQINLLSSSSDQHVSVHTEGDNKDVYNRLFKEMIGKKFTIVMEPGGTVKSIGGLDAIFDKMIKAVPEVKSKEKPTLKKFLQSQFGAEELKSTLSFVLPYYPGHKVQTGDSWMSQLYTEGFYHGRIDNYWKLDYGDNYTIKLSNNGKFTTDATELIDLGSGEEGYIDLKGELQGKYVIDPETKWPSMCIIHTELNGHYTYKAAKKRKRDIKVPVRVVMDASYNFKHL